MDDTIKEDLELSLSDVIAAINRQLSYLEDRAEALHIPLYQMQNTDGSFAASSLLVAKANAIVALSNVQREAANATTTNIVTDGAGREIGRSANAEESVRSTRKPATPNSEHLPRNVVTQ